MYIAHPTHGAGTRPNRTLPPTTAQKTTLNAGQCVRQPREGRWRNRQAPPPKKRGGKEGGRGNSPQPRNRPPTPQEAAKPPRRHHERHRRPMSTPPSPLRPYTTPTPSPCHHRSRSPRRRQCTPPPPNVHLPLPHTGPARLPVPPAARTHPPPKAPATTTPAPPDATKRATAAPCPPLAHLALHNPHIWANSLKPVCLLCFLLFWCPLLPFIETGTLKIYTKMVLYMQNEFLTSNTPHGV